MARRTGVREKWYAEVLRTRLVGDACRVLLLHMAHEMTERGLVKIPRDKLAEALGVHPKRITDRVTEATRAKLLIRVAGGYNGQVVTYQAQMPQPEEWPVRSPEGPVTGPASLAAFMPPGTARRGTLTVRRTGTREQESEPAPD
ncbi:hypothetical protein ACI8AA_01095 [Geodermatophilus sp. SYSU D01180]